MPTIIIPEILYMSRQDKQMVNEHLEFFQNDVLIKDTFQVNFLICCVNYIQEAIAVGRSFASFKGYHIDGNKEMVSIGFMNIVGSLTSCYAATGT